MRNPAKDIESADHLWARALEQQWNDTPEHLKKLGDVLRRSVGHDVAELAAFLSQHEITVDAHLLEVFRDVLIVKRIDLKDLEPEARARLRARLLQADDSSQMTPDYLAAVKDGEVPRCRACRWFVTAPGDGSPGGDRPCTSYGTKGADQACFGFTQLQS